MELRILFGVFTLLMLIGTPIAFCLGVSSFATVLYMGLPPLIVFQRLNSGMSVFSLLAIPFFIYAGDLMVRGGIAQKIVAFAASLVGHIRGGLGQVNIVTATLFGGISGSAVAEAAAVGGLMIPQMKARGYGADYAVNVTSMAALIALLLPPSHNMIIYSISAGGKISIADLFTAGIIPGCFLPLSLMVTAYFVARSRGYPTEPFPGFKAVGQLLPHRNPRPAADRHHFRRRALRHLHRDGKLLHRRSLRAVRDRLRLPADELGRFRARHLRRGAHHGHGAPDHRHGRRLLLADGVSQGAGVARRLDEHHFRKPDHHPAADQCADAVAWHLHGHGADDHHHHADLPAGGQAYGIDPVHFGVIMILNFGIGLNTPPVGAVQFVCCAVGKISVWEAMRSIWPFYGAGLVVLGLVTYIPALSLWLPSVFK